MTFVKKRKGKYYGELIWNFLDEKNKNHDVFFLCHGNDMHLETCLPIRKEISNIHFGFRFLKRRPILKFFDEKNDLKSINILINGSLLLLYPKKKKIMDFNIFQIISKQQNLSFLGIFWKRFYLIFDLFRIFSQLGIFDIKNKGKNLFEITNLLKFFSFMKIKFYFSSRLEISTILNSLQFFNQIRIKLL